VSEQISTKLRRLKLDIPDIKKVCLGKASYTKLKLELLDLQRFGVNGLAEHVMGPIIFDGIRVYKDESKES